MKRLHERKEKIRQIFLEEVEKEKIKFSLNVSQVNRLLLSELLSDDSSFLLKEWKLRMMYLNILHLFWPVHPDQA